MTRATLLAAASLALASRCLVRCEGRQLMRHMIRKVRFFCHCSGTNILTEHNGDCRRHCALLGRARGAYFVSLCVREWLCFFGMPTARQPAVHRRHAVFSIMSRKLEAWRNYFCLWQNFSNGGQKTILILRPRACQHHPLTTPFLTLTHADCPNLQPSPPSFTLPLPPYLHRRPFLNKSTT